MGNRICQCDDNIAEQASTGPNTRRKIMGRGINVSRGSRSNFLEVSEKKAITPKKVLVIN